jgi:hypothetical protein
VLPAEAADELRAIVTDPQHTVAGYWINRRFMFLDRWMRHAYYPNWNMRLFRHRAGRFERLAQGPTDSGDNEVHEHVLIDGPTGRLRSEMLHYPFPDIATFIEKHNRYSNWEARVAMEDGHAAEARKDETTVAVRRRIKRWVRRLPCRPTLRFVWIYFFQLGMLDGREGYYFARLHAMYETLSTMKTWELKRRRAGH